MKRGVRYTKAQKVATKEKFIELLKKSGGILKPACEALHMSRQTVLDWRKEDPEFDKACLEACELFLDEAESRLYAAVRRGNFKAVKFYLEHKGRSRGYDQHQDIDLTASVIRPRVIFEDDPERNQQDPETN